MAKTTVNNLVSKMKLRYDYNIVDTDLDSLLIGCINDALKLIYQSLADAGSYLDISGSTSFKTTKSQSYIDLQVARIVGDATTFTGAGSDKIKVTIDGTAYDNIDISACTTIAGVVAAINSACTAGSPASADDDGYLVITSLTTGASSAVIIADASTGDSAVADLFSVAADRTSSALTNMDEPIKISERSNDISIEVIPYADFIELYPDPTSTTSNTPFHAAIWNNRLYLGPTPSDSTVSIYIEHRAIPADVVAGGTLPYLTKYDPLLIALARVEYLQFFDANNTGAIRIAQGIAEGLEHKLITAASRNVGMNLQTASRRDGGFDRPRIPDTPGDIGP